MFKVRPGITPLRAANFPNAPTHAASAQLRARYPVPAGVKTGDLSNKHSARVLEEGIRSSCECGPFRDSMSSIPNARPHIQVQQLTLQFEGKVILEAIDLTVTRGERIFVVGPSGTGKSRLLRAVAHLDYHPVRVEGFVEAVCG